MGLPASGIASLSEGRPSRAQVGPIANFRLGPAASLAMSVGFAALYGWSLFVRHSVYDTNTFDLGLIAQVVWNSLQGHFFANSVMPFNYLAEHFSPALVLVSPLFLLWRDVEILFVVQVLAVAAAGIGIFLAARQRTGSVIAALLLQLAFQVAPATASLAIDEFHPISLAVPAAAFATALLWSRRYRSAAIVAALALMANEDAVLWVVPFGLLIVAWGRREGWRPGLVVSALAIAWLAVYMFLTVPAWRSPDLTTLPHPDVWQFSHCGETVSEVIGCVALNPVTTLQWIARPKDLAAIGSLFGPTAWLGLLGSSFLVVVPRWLVVLLSDSPRFQGHYGAFLAPAAYLAAAEAIALVRRLVRMPAYPLAALVAAFSLVAFFQSSPLPGSPAYQPYANQSPARVKLIDRAVQMIPADPTVSIVATNHVLPHLALRSRINLIFDDVSAPPDYRIIDLRDPYPVKSEDLQHQVALWRSDPEYKIVVDQDDLLVMKRQYTPPDRSVVDDFGGSVRLTGYTIAPLDGEVRVLLYWQTAGPRETEYHYFVHLVDDQGKGFSQQDGELANGYLPSEQWKAGAVVWGAMALAAPARAEWSRYSLEIGWYDIKTGERLKLPDGRDHVTLPLAATSKDW